MREYNNLDCELNGTEVCRALNMRKCKECPISSMRQYEQKRAAQDLLQLMEMMPEGALHELYTGSECVLCAGAEKNKKQGYALIDIVKPRDSEKGFYKGIPGISPKEGYIVPVQFGVCNRCKKNHMTAVYAPLAISIGIGLVPVILLSIRSVRESFAALSQFLPVALFVLIELTAIVLYCVLRNHFVKKLSKQTVLNVMDLNELKAMADNGWIELSKGKNRNDYRVSSLVFAERPLSYGIFTGKQEKDAQQNQTESDSGKDCT